MCSRGWLGGCPPPCTCTGSVPIETLRHTILYRHAELFGRVVGHKPGAWLDFLTRHATTFVVFYDAYRHFRRVRLLWQAEGWQLVDEQAEFRRSAYERCILAAIVRHVGLRPRGCTVDDFVRVCPPDLPLPRRGDLVRLIRKHRQWVRFDRDTFELSLP